MGHHDMPEALLPPGQVATKKFPITGERAARTDLLPLAHWRLSLGGRIAKPLEVTYGEFLALPQRKLLADIHCVTGWSRIKSSFIGIPLASFLMELRVEPLPEARFVRFVAYSSRGHDTSLPIEVARADTWLVHSADGQPLSPEHGYPLRTVTPSRYFYKSLKWLHRIEFLAEDRLGYWERESFYHNNADPWPGNERYTTGSHNPKRVENLRTASSFVPYRGPKKLFLGVDLRGWTPSTRDLGDLYLKNCDLRGAQLDGVDLKKANLTRSDLGRASLVGANLQEADLEGASFVGADLTGANLRGTALSATRFFEREPAGRLVGAKIDGMRWDGARGLLEEQEDFLSGRIR